jgi:hypothetical protein
MSYTLIGLSRCVQANRSLIIFFYRVQDGALLAMKLALHFKRNSLILTDAAMSTVVGGDRDFGGWAILKNFKAVYLWKLS